MMRVLYIIYSRHFVYIIVYTCSYHIRRTQRTKLYKYVQHAYLIEVDLIENGLGLKYICAVCVYGARYEWWRPAAAATAATLSIYHFSALLLLI